MATDIDVLISADSTLDFFPLRVRREGEDFLVGRTDAASFLAMRAPAVEALDLLRVGRSPAAVKRELAARHGSPDVSLGSFLETLVAARFVRAVDGVPITVAAPAPAPPPRRLSRESTAWLFSLPAALACALLLAAGGWVLLSDPSYLPRPRDLRVSDRYAVSAVAMLVLTLLLTAKHEVAHLLAARHAGTDASIGIGHRLFFPVLQTDMTRLWAAPRRLRFLGYAAGIVSDLLVAALALVALRLGAMGLLPQPELLGRLLRALVAVPLVLVAWQLNFFFRTDTYFMLSDALGCRDLYADAWRQIRLWTHRALRRGPAPPPVQGSPRERAIVRGYAVTVLLGQGAYLLLGIVYLVQLLEFVLPGSTGSILPGRAAPAGPWDRPVALLLFCATLAMLAVGVVRRRRRARAVGRYRLVGGAEL